MSAPTSPVLTTFFPELKDTEAELAAAAEAATLGDTEGAVQAAAAAEALAAAQKKIALVALAVALAVVITLAIKKKALPKMLRWVQHPAVVVPALAVGVTGAVFWYKRSSAAANWSAEANKMLEAQKAGDNAVIEEE